jgi:hypothetical protein
LQQFWGLGWDSPRTGTFLPDKNYFIFLFMYNMPKKNVNKEQVEDIKDVVVEEEVENESEE